MFTRLNEMRIGDTFTITVLGEKMTYQVDQIKVVLPDDLSQIAVEKDRDLVTLMTCTPYGQNTHRLLVRGTRIPNADATTRESIGAEPMVRLIAFLIGLLMIVSLIRRRHRRRRRATTATVVRHRAK